MNCKSDVVNKNSEYLFWTWWAWETQSNYRRIGKIYGSGPKNPKEVNEWSTKIHGEDIISQVADLGINCAVCAFYKGAGIKAEWSEMEATKEFVERCHKKNIKVFGYVQFSIIYYETMLDEIPDLHDWIKIDKNGKPVLWCEEYYRYMACLSNPKLLPYLKKIVKFGVEEIGFDGLHFDNTYSRPCYCPRCINKFRESLKDKYKSPWEEIAITNLDNTLIPLLPDNPNAPVSGLITDPIYRDWANYRNKELNDTVADLRGYCESLNPDIMLLFNPNCIRGPLNQTIKRGANPINFGAKDQYLWAEGGNHPGVEGNNLVHQVNYFKTGDAAGNRQFSTTWVHTEGNGLSLNEESLALNTAETAAFGAVPGANWLLRPLPGESSDTNLEKKNLTELLKKQITFIRDRLDLFHASKSDAQIALIYDYDSMVFDFARNYCNFLVLQEVLLRNHISYVILSTENLKDIHNYSTAILPIHPNKEFIKNPLLSKFIAQQGKLISFDNSNLNGDIVYYRKDNWQACVDGGFRTITTLPEDSDQFAAFIKNECSNAINFAGDISDKVLIECRITKDNRHILHFINYNNKENVKKITINFKDKTSKAIIHSPEFAENIKITADNGKFVLPEFKTWLLMELV